MKKIIYSLVIMIAAGSLFTSCIEQVEPEGIRNMRDAKADYIRSLKDVNAADAELKRAEAAVRQADAAYTAARTAWESEFNKLLNEEQALKNELKAAQNEEEAAQIADRIARAEMELEKAQKQHEADMLNMEALVAQAQKDLRDALRNIELASKSLTEDEMKVLVSAAGAYYATVEALTKMNQEIAEAQHKVSEAKKDLENETMKWDNNSHKKVKAIEMYEGKIAAAQKEITALEAKLASADGLKIEDIEKWQKEIEGYEKAINEELLKLKEIEMEQAHYKADYVHDGLTKFDNEIKKWLEENPKEYAALSEAEEKELAKGEPKQENFKAGNAALITFPVLEVKSGKPAYDKFMYLLSSYMSEPNIFPLNQTVKPDTTVLMKFDNKGEHKYDTLKVFANQAMKAFVLGDENGDKGSQSVRLTANKVNYDFAADYGLYGAVSVLKRDKVLNPLEPADLDALKADMEAKKDAWQADYDTLTKGLYEYKPFADALDQYKEFIKKNAGAANGMVSAIEALAEAFDSMQSDNTDFSAVEANALFAAIVDFAKARENYLVYDYSEEMEDEAYDHGAMNDFCYKTTKSGSKKYIKFSAMTQANLYKGAYQCEKTATEIAEMDKDEIFEDVVLPTLTAIVDQFFGGSEDADAYDYNYSMSNKQSFKISEINNNLAAFYGFYEYVPEADNHENKGAHIHYAEKIDGHNKGDVYNPTSKEADAVKDAVVDYMKVYNRFWAEDDSKNEAKITNAVADYLEALVKQANLSVEEDAEEDDIKAADEKVAETEAAMNNALKALNDLIYTLDTFTKPYNAITFVGEEKIVYTEAMGAILGSVDPNRDGATGDYFEADGLVEKEGVNHTRAAVFFGEGTDEGKITTEFYDFMYASYVYELALNPAKDDIDEIEDWVKAVEAAFEKDAENAEKDDKKAYEAALKAFNDLKERSENYEAFNKSITEFVGTHKEIKNGKEVEVLNFTYSQLSNVNKYGYFIRTQNAKGKGYWTVDNEAYTYEGVEIPIARDYKPYIDPETGKESGYTWSSIYLLEEVIGYYTGEWDTTKIGGQMLKNAKDFFPKWPAKIKEWVEAFDEIKDNIEHNQIKKDAAKNAYYFAAAAAGYFDDIKDQLKKDYNKPVGWDELEKAYEDAKAAYLESIQKQIEKKDKDIEGWYKDIADVEKSVSEAEFKLSKAEAALQAAKDNYAVLEKASALAKANYDKVLEYIQAQDFSFIDFNALLKTVDGMLKDLPDAVKGKVQSILSSVLNRF